MNIIIPIGGVGKRFSEDGYSLPKPFIKSLGKSIISWNLGSLNLSSDDIVYIVYRDEFRIFNFENLIKNEFRNINFNFIPIKNDTRGASETVLYALKKMSESALSNITLVLDSDNFYDEDILDICRKKKTNLIFYKKDFDENPLYSYVTIDKESKILDIQEKQKISDNACVGAYCFISGKLLKNTIESVIIEERKQKNEFYISSLYKFMIDNDITVFSNEIDGFNCLGTPKQLKSFSSNFNTKKEKYRFCFDLDNTLVTYPEIEGDYNSVKPIQRVINFLNFLHSEGHTIIIYTARRMKTHAGNVGRVHSDIGKITFDTLDRFKINYDEIYFGKPYAHFYIDDLSVRPSEDLEKETGFYNIHPEARTHNRIEVFEKYVTKFSDSLEGEIYFYQNIPISFIDFFPKLLDSGKNYIKIEKINGMPFSFLNVNNTLSNKILNKLLLKIEQLHSIKTELPLDIYSNYYKKVKNRIDNYDFSDYENFESVKNNILDFLKKYEESQSGVLGMIHGDPVFTNILLDTNDSIKMIDMRGKVGDSYSIYGDIFYDYAKIYQSLIGYDHILLEKEFYDKSANSNLIYFENYVIEKFGSGILFNIKQITKSLLLSLIPIHNNNKCQKFFQLINKIK